MIGVPIRRENRYTGKETPCEDPNRHRQREDVKIEAEIEVVLPQIKNSWGYWKLEEAGKNPSLEASEGAWP